MAVEIRYASTHWTDFGWILQGLRDADRAECEAAGIEPLRALHHSFERSPRSMRWTILADDEPIAMMGCADLGDHGEPWMLGTDGVRRHGRVLIRSSGPYIVGMLQAHPVLSNYVHAENHVSIAWLKRTGFEIGHAAPYGAHGALFHRFEMRR